MAQAGGRRRLALVASGAGAGLAAAFHAPLAGFVFVIEELQQELAPAMYAMVLMAAVVADIIITSAAGQSTVSTVPVLPTLGPSSLLVFAMIGIIFGYLGALFNVALLRTMRFYRKIRAPLWARAGVIGGCVGLAAWWLPQSIGTGNDATFAMLHGGYSHSGQIVWLFLMFAGRFVLTILSYVSGVPGGLFAPQLVMGSALGLGFGLIVATLFPSLNAMPLSCAVMGMAAFFSAVVRTPLTGIVLILEMTGDYDQLLPLLVAAMCAYLVSEPLHIEPVYDALLELEMKPKA